MYGLGVFLGFVFWTIGSVVHCTDLPTEVRENGFLVILMTLGVAAILALLLGGSYMITKHLFRYKKDEEKEIIMAWTFCGLSLLYFGCSVCYLLTLN